MATNKKENTKLMGMDLGVDMDEKVLRWVLIIIGEIAFIVVISLIFIIPQVTTIQKINAELEKLQKAANDLAYKSELLDTFSADFSQDEQILTAIFPQNKNIGIFLQSIRKVAQERSVELALYTVREEGGKTGSSNSKKATTIKQETISFELTINASPESTRLFIQDLNTSLPLKSVDTFQVIKNISADPSGPQVIQSKIMVTGYYLPFSSDVDSSKPLAPFGPKQEAALTTLKGYKNHAETTVNSTITPTGTIRNQSLFVTE